MPKTKIYIQPEAYYRLFPDAQWLARILYAKKPSIPDGYGYQLWEEIVEACLEGSGYGEPKTKQHFMYICYNGGDDGPL